MKTDPTPEDPKNLEWAEEVSGLSELKLAKLARSGLIPGSFNLTRSRKGWRFREVQFRAWLDKVSQSGLSTPEVTP